MSDEKVTVEKTRVDEKSHLSGGQQRERQDPR